ncbi:MAG: hypothetical protein RRY78_05955 [Clostridia bacterium]
MYKKIIVCITALCVIIGTICLILGLTGVFSAKDKDIRINNISGFEKLTTKPCSIKVTFSDEYVGEFTTVDEEQIDKIHKLLLDRTYTQRKKGDLKPPGTNRRLSFIYADSSQLNFDASWITLKDGMIYSPQTYSNVLDAYLEEIGLLLDEIVLR